MYIRKLTTTANNLGILQTGTGENLAAQQQSKSGIHFVSLKASGFTHPTTARGHQRGLGL